MKLWLIRHGESTSNAGLPVNGHDEVPLTAKGQAQAAAAALMLPAMPDLLIDSPFLRARATADAIARRWPALRRETWPIHEVTYLSRSRCNGSTRASRQPLVDGYWRRSDPHHVDGDDAESFATFLDRVDAFHRRVRALDAEFVVAVGHGQFFSAYLHALTRGFDPSPAWMRAYRAAETRAPLRNAQIVRLTVSAGNVVLDTPAQSR